MQNNKQKYYYKNCLLDILPKQQLCSTADWPALKTLRIFSRTSAKSFNIPQKPTGKTLDSKTLQEEYLIRKLMAENMENIINPNTVTFQKELLTLLTSYSDINFCHEDILTNLTDIQNCFCLHALNHVLRSRIIVSQNNTTLSQMTEEEKEQSDIRDQGLTRPKVSK